MILWWVGCAGSGPTVSGDLVLETPADVRAASRVEHVEGDLVIEATELEAVVLPALAWIGGELRIWENPRLSTWHAPVLDEVARDLSLFDDAALDTLEGFAALRRVGGVLRVSRLPALAQLTAPSPLEELGGLYAYRDDALASVDLGGVAAIHGDVELWELAALSTVDLGAVEAVEGKLDLFDNDRLTSLEAPALTALRAYELHHCDAMRSAGALPLTELPGGLVLQYNGALEGLGRLDGLVRVGGATIRFNAGLEQLDSGALERVEGTLTVANNRFLTGWSAPALREVRVLEIVGHEALTDVSLPALERVQGARVVDNEGWATCAIEALLDRLEPELVVCHGNEAGPCADWCTEAAP